MLIFFSEENKVKIDALDDTIANVTSDVYSLNDSLDQLNNTLKYSLSNLSNKMDKVNITLQETASDMNSLNNSLGKISSSKSQKPRTSCQPDKKYACAQRRSSCFKFRVLDHFFILYHSTYLFKY